MPITAMATVAPGDTITSAGYNIVTGNISLLDARTGGDPGSADKWLVSSGALGAAWVARLTAVLAAIGYTPANKAGETFTGNLQISLTAAPTTGYLILGNDGAKYFGFDGAQFVIVGDSLQVAGLITAVAGLLSTGDLQAYRSGAPSTGYLLLGSGGTHFVGFDGSNIVADGSKVWTDGNDGPASGLAAQTADTANSATSAASATTAATATNALSLGGSLAALYALLANPAFTGTPTRNSQTIPMFKTGTYAGAGSAGDQRTIGFLAQFMVLYGTNGSAQVVHFLRSSTASQNIKLAGIGSSVAITADSTTRLDASDGFFAATADGGDTSGYTYYWAAWG